MLLALVSLLFVQCRSNTSTSGPQVIDFGLRLTDVEEESLESESVTYKEHDPSVNLKRNGATEEEIDFLIEGYRHGQRVELNAFTSDHFIDWLERKLKAHSIEKTIPDDKALEEGYRRALYVRHLNESLEQADKEARDLSGSATLPDDLRERLMLQIEQHSEMAWDEVLCKLVKEGSELQQASEEAA